MRVLVACEYSGVADPDDGPVMIPGFPAYRIYRDGRLESRWRSGMFYRGFEVEDRWRVPKLSRHQRGYVNVTLRDGLGGQRRTHIHVLVAEAFIGPKPFPKAVVRHLDNDPTNNHVSNLAWGTYKDNEDDKIAHGTWNTRYGGAKLTPENVIAIRDRCAVGEPHQQIADDYGVSRPTVTRIANHVTWVHR